MIMCKEASCILCDVDKDTAQRSIANGTIMGIEGSS